MYKVLLILDKLFLKYNGEGGRIEPSPQPKSTFKKPITITATTF